MRSFRRLFTRRWLAGILPAATAALLLAGCSGGDPAGEAPTKEEVVQRRKNKEDALKEMLNPTGGPEQAPKGGRPSSKPTTKSYQDL